MRSLSLVLNTDATRRTTVGIMNRILAASVLIAILGLGTIGCNTVKGAGRDIERGGEKLQHESDEHRDRD